mgnify:CR=1 FL=1
MASYGINHVRSVIELCKWVSSQCLMDFFFWGHLKNKVFSTPPRDIDELRNRITNEVNVLRNDPGMIRRAVEGMQQIGRASCRERV